MAGNCLQQQDPTVSLLCSGGFCLRKPDTSLGAQKALEKPKEELLTEREKEGKWQVLGMWLYPRCLVSL